MSQGPHHGEGNIRQGIVFDPAGCRGDPTGFGTLPLAAGYLLKV